jgi:hypothetical protein
LGKSFLFLWNTSFSPCKIVPVGHRTGVIFYSSRKYFSWPSLVLLTLRMSSDILILQLDNCFMKFCH